MDSINLKKYGKQEISFYLGLEEYLIKHNMSNLFFIWDIDKSVIIGKHQLLEKEVNVKYCNENDIKIYRRVSGGGAVYADDGCFMFTFITRNINKDEAFNTYLNVIKSKFKDIGLDIEISGRNDLIYNNKKFSGNSIYIDNGYSILHGSILYNTNIDELVKSITPDDNKLISKGIESVRQRVINLKEYIKLSKEELMAYFVDSIGERIIELDDSIINEVKELEKKYLSHNWIYNNNPSFTFKNDIRFKYGKLNVFIDTKKNKIKDIELFGDFFEIKDIKEFLNSFINKEYNLNTFKSILNNININDYILNSSNYDFLKLCFDLKEEKNE